jgi:hypothetical protein
MPNVFKVLAMAEILIVMESSVAPVTVALPAAMLLPSISVMATVVAPIVSILTPFLPLPFATLVIASPVEVPMLA